VEPPRPHARRLRERQRGRGSARADRSDSGLVLGSSAFDSQLETLNGSFVTAGADPTQRPNRNAIGQIRTEAEMFEVLGEPAE